MLHPTSYCMLVILLVLILSWPSLSLRRRSQTGTGLVRSRRRDLCLYEGRTYRPGKRFWPEPCMRCRCPKRGGRADCSITDCIYDPTCLRHAKVTRKVCCPRCLEKGCFYRKDKQVHAVGTNFSTNPCEHCMCPGEGQEPVCTMVSCPQLKCIDTTRQQHVQCCPVCQAGQDKMP